MAQQQHAADVHPDELCPPNKRYDLMDANKKVDLEHVQCPPESKILTNIIKNHPLRFSIAASSSVPWIYMAQFWHTLKEDGSKYRLKFMLDKKELSLTLDDFRTIFHLPQANDNNHNSFVPPPSFLDMVPFYKQQLGFTMELKTSSSFKTTGLLQPWQTLCKIFSKCLTTRVTDGSTAVSDNANENPRFQCSNNRTIWHKRLQAPIEGYEDAIVVPPINANNFELKQTLINLVQSNQFTGRQDPHNHLRFFNKVTSTFRHPEVPNTSIKLLLFPFSLEGEARTWLDKEPPRSILTWDDLVSKFINQFFPPSKTTYLRNEITTFLQKPNETFNEAWERFKGLLRQCPHHGFSELHQLDTFYNSLNTNDQDALDSAAGGNFLDKMPREEAIIEEVNPSLVIKSVVQLNQERVRKLLFSDFYTY
ncbi:reverse transcriptase domain-containing protein [Tanacetum coccineum]